MELSKTSNVLLVIIGFLYFIIHSACLLQHPDRTYDISIKFPTYIDYSPKILYDEAHLNTHTAKGTYSPLVNLYLNDGCTIEINRDEFTDEALNEYDLLIISNAKSHKSLARDVGAFHESEDIIIRDWVSGGGNLLLVADHHPFGLANRKLARIFGVEMGCGRAIDTSSQNHRKHGIIEFNRQNGLLLEHPITSGRSSDEQVDRVLTFSGQSLKNLGTAASLLEFGEHVMEERPDSIWTIDGENRIKFGEPIRVQGLSQAFAIEVGLGRVVILGEAGMLSAQKFLGRKFGMNDESQPDNKQFALNILHWLLEKEMR